MQKIIDYKIYDCCGNIIAVVVIEGIDLKKFFQYQIDVHIREELTRLGKLNKCDSMMLIPDNFDKPATIVFEPNGGESNLGTFSTMCGNGIRAVAHFLSNKLHKNELPIETKSGSLVAKQLNGKFEVSMGKLYENEMMKYVRSNNFNFSNNKFSLLGMGLTCNPDALEVDGEPHLILVSQDRNFSLEELYDYTLVHGQKITKNSDLFPYEVNVSFVSYDLLSNSKIRIVTHERNLGNDPNRSITKACGTASTVTAGLIAKNRGKDMSFDIECLGGCLYIRIIAGILNMSGDAKPI